MKDIVEFTPEFSNKEVFLALIRSIIQSVERCRAITHRLLGFAKRMDVEIEILDINELVKEVLGFLEKEALYRNIKIGLHLAGDLPRLASDRGQLQQVFLNILNNAFAAVQDGGTVSVVTSEERRHYRHHFSGYGSRHVGRDSKTYFRTVFHHKERPRNRSGIVYYLWNREKAWRRH